MPEVCSIMDLGYLEFSEQFRKKYFGSCHGGVLSVFLYQKRSLRISNSTKADIVRHYPFAKNKIYVTHLAYDNTKFNVSIPEKDVRRVMEKYSIVDDYVLYLGTLKPSKNIDGLIEAFAHVNHKKPGIRLVVAGKKGWMFESIFKKVKELGLTEKVLFTDLFQKKISQD